VTVPPVPKTQVLRPPRRLGDLPAVQRLSGLSIAGSGMNGKGHLMSRNETTVRDYMRAFARSDHAAVLACLTDDVEWALPGVFHLRGKRAFDGEIENAAFVGRPSISITRVTEKDDVVIAEGTVRVNRRGAGIFNAAYCDVFVMRDGRIRQLTSYLMETAPNESMIGESIGDRAETTFF
jgi:ketosteroid isomerase-like protein